MEMEAQMWVLLSPSPCQSINYNLIQLKWQEVFAEPVNVRVKKGKQI